MRSISSLHAIEEHLKSHTVKGRLLYCKQNKRIEMLLDQARKKGLNLEKVKVEELDQYGNHNGIMLIEKQISVTHFSSLEEYLQTDLAENALVLLLDNITDMHNLGAIIRSSDLFGVACVIIPSRRSAKAGKDLTRTSAGADAYVPILTVNNLARTIELLKKEGFWIYGADMHGTEAYAVNLKGKTALVLGSEDKGLGDLTSKLCDQIISIPTIGHIDSLNVSVAAGILMYEVRRQQKVKSSH